MKYAVIDATTGKIINWSRNYNLMFKFALFHCPAKYYNIDIVKITREGRHELWQYIIRIDRR